MTVNENFIYVITTCINRNEIISIIRKIGVGIRIRMGYVFFYAWPSVVRRKLTMLFGRSWTKRSCIQIFERETLPLRPKTLAKSCQRNSNLAFLRGPKSLSNSWSQIRNTTRYTTRILCLIRLARLQFERAKIQWTSCWYRQRDKS